MGRFFNESLHTQGKTDEEIRQCCLEQIRGQLTTNIGGRHSDDALERAAKFAAIAQASAQLAPTTDDK